VPPLVEETPGHQVACFFPVSELPRGKLIRGADPGVVQRPAPEVDSFSETYTDLGAVGVTRLDSGHPREHNPEVHENP
jgi:hypothetical protein